MNAEFFFNLICFFFSSTFLGLHLDEAKFEVLRTIAPGIWGKEKIVGTL